MKSILVTFIAIQSLLMIPQSEAFAPHAATTSSSKLSYTNEDTTVDAGAKISLPAPTKKIRATRLTPGKKASVPTISSIDELKYFLEEDDRLVAIK